MAFFGKYYFASHAIGKGQDELLGRLLQAEHDEGEGWQPAVDLFETEDAITAIVELPGISPDDLALMVMHQTLIVRGERRAEPGDDIETRRYRRMEIRHGSFERMVPLPCTVSAARSEATLHRGVLRIKMPRTRSRKMVNAQIVVHFLPEEESC